MLTESYRTVESLKQGKLTTVNQWINDFFHILSPFSPALLDRCIIENIKELFEELIQDGMPNESGFGIIGNQLYYQLIIVCTSFKTITIGIIHYLDNDDSDNKYSWKYSINGHKTNDFYEVKNEVYKMILGNL